MIAGHKYTENEKEKYSTFYWILFVLITEKNIFFISLNLGQQFLIIRFIGIEIVTLSFTEENEDNNNMKSI